MYDGIIIIMIRKHMARLTSTWRQFQSIAMPAVLGSASPGFHDNGSSAV
jgi:hypothetical protein